MPRVYRARGARSARPAQPWAGTRPRPRAARAAPRAPSEGSAPGAARGGRRRITQQQDVGLGLLQGWQHSQQQVSGTGLAVGRPLAGQWPANGRPMAGQWPANGRPMAGQWPAKGRPIRPPFREHPRFDGTFGRPQVEWKLMVTFFNSLVKLEPRNFYVWLYLVRLRFTAVYV